MIRDYFMDFNCLPSIGEGSGEAERFFVKSIKVGLSGFCSCKLCIKLNAYRHLCLS